MPTRRCLPLVVLLLAAGLAHGAPADPPHPPGARAASGAASGAAAGCPGRGVSSPEDARRPSSKLRHTPAENDPCDTSFGLGRPLRRLPPASSPE